VKPAAFPLGLRHSRFTQVAFGHLDKVGRLKMQAFACIRWVCGGIPKGVGHALKLQTRPKNYLDPMAIDEDSTFNNFARAIPEESLFARLSEHLTGMSRFLAAIPEEKAGYAYAPEKWAVRQVVGHIWVWQRIFVTRAVMIARGETQPLPGHDENALAVGWPGEDVTVADLAEAYTAEAKAAQIWFLMLEEDDLRREGTVNGKRVRAEQLLRALIGHESHHRKVLAERYGISDLEL
jgi:uncharacterized damage-inducible protein DinB